MSKSLTCQSAFLRGRYVDYPYPDSAVGQWLHPRPLLLANGMMKREMDGRGVSERERGQQGRKEGDWKDNKRREVYRKYDITNFKP